MPYDSGLLMVIGDNVSIGAHACLLGPSLLETACA